MVKAPIPFTAKIALFEQVVAKQNEDSLWNVALDDLGTTLRNLYMFRNTVAHSFPAITGFMTSRGQHIPTERVSKSAIEAKIKEAERVQQWFGAMFEALSLGYPPPTSADDIADSPL